MKKCVLLALLVFCGVLPACFNLENEAVTEAIKEPVVEPKIKESIDEPILAVKDDQANDKNAVQVQKPVLADNREAKVRSVAN